MKVIAIYILTFVVGISILFDCANNIVNKQKSSSWPNTIGTIINSKEYRRDSLGYIEFTVSYSINNKTYEIHEEFKKYNFNKVSDGKNISINYNPSNPSDAIIYENTGFVFYIQ